MYRANQFSIFPLPIAPLPRTDYNGENPITIAVSCLKSFTVVGLPTQPKCTIAPCHAPFPDSSCSQKGGNRERSVEDIHLDVLRTFPTLGFFQEVWSLQDTLLRQCGTCHLPLSSSVQGGPYNHTLHDVLGAYACYRPDVGYVQGMSFLAAVLLLNLEAPEAFVCLANLLNRPSYLAFFKVDYTLMKPYFDTFRDLLHSALPRLDAHFCRLEFSPEYYLIEW